MLGEDPGNPPIVSKAQHGPFPLSRICRRHQRRRSLGAAQGEPQGPAGGRAHDGGMELCRLARHFLAGPESALRGMAELPLLLCRSGARSRAAAIALTEAGFAQAFNIAGGFEGDMDGEGHRGNREGWKAENLPWRQG